MSFSTKIRAMLGRTIRAVPDGHPGCIAEPDSPSPLTFVAESQLPGSPAALIRSGIIQPWRTDSRGERWHRVIDAESLADWSPLDSPVAVADDADDPDDFDGYDPDAAYSHGTDDPDDDPFTALPVADDDDDDFDDFRNPYRSDGHER